MAPLIQDYDFAITTHDDVIDEVKTIVLPLHQHSMTRSRCVSFGVTVDTFEVLNRNEYTPEEMEASWFDRNDMRRMKESARSDAKLMESGLLVQGEDVSTRGLESRTRDGMKRKRQSRMNAYAAVFFEIDCQDEEGFYDDELIADAYFIHSDPCATTAQMIAKRDELEASEIMQKHESDFFGSFYETISDLSITRGSLASSAA